MPGSDDTDNLTDEDLAAIDEYENSEEGRAVRPAPESRAGQLTKLFMQTPEMQEYRRTADSINNRSERGRYRRRPNPRAP